MARPCRVLTGFLVGAITLYDPSVAPSNETQHRPGDGPILTLVCHAPTAAVRAAAFPADEPLGPADRVSAAAAPRFRRVDAAWTSPALRARQTAEALGLTAHPAPALGDLDHGCWTGRTLADVANADPAGVSAWMSDPEAAPHGGESVAALLARVSGWLDGVAGQGGRIVGVTHAAVLRAAVVAVLEAAPAAFWRIDVAPLCRVRLRARGGRWTLLGLGVPG